MTRKTAIMGDGDFIKPPPCHRLHAQISLSNRKSCDKVTSSDRNVLLLRRLEILSSFYNK